MRVEDQLDTIRSLAQRLVHPNDVDDLVQEVCLLIQANPPRHERRVVGWIRTIVRRKAISLFRSERRRSEHERRAATEYLRARSALPPQESEAVNVLRRAVDALPEPYRTTVTLRFYDDVPPMEISRLTGRPLQTVYTHLQRGRRHLRDRLASLAPPPSDDGIEFPGAPEAGG
ncbi:MAG: RNA polymerase sigma factor [Planctomycetota bacterium]